MNDALLEHHRIVLDESSRELLLASRSRFFEGVMRAALVWPIKKIVKKVVLVFMLKACADIAAVVFHEGWLLARALEQQYIDEAALRRRDARALRHLRAAILKASDAVDIRLTQQLMRSVFDVSSELVGALITTFRRVGRRHFRANPAPAAERVAAPLAARIEAIIKDQWLLGASLDHALEAACRD